MAYHRKFQLYLYSALSKLRACYRNPGYVKFYTHHYGSLLLSPNADVVVVSYPKSGRTWLEELIVTSVRMRDSIPSDYEINLARHRPSIQFTHACSSWESRLLDASQLSVVPNKYRGMKVVLLYRDPRDVLVSSYYHMKYRTGVSGVTIDEMIHSKLVGLRKVIAFMNVWLTAVKQRGDSGLMLSYEELQRDTYGMLSKFLAFACLDVPDECVRNAVELCKFERMQAEERSGVSESPWRNATDKSDSRSFKVRNGKIGEYKRFFSPQQLKQTEEIIEKELDGSFAEYHCGGVSDEANVTCVQRSRDFVS